MLKNLSIAARLRISAVLPLIILLCISIYAWSGLRSGSEALHSVHKDSLTSRTIGSIATDMYRIRMVLANAVIADEPPEMASLVKSGHAGMTEIMTKWNTYLESGLTPEQKLAAEKSGKELDRLLDSIFQPALVALSRNDREAAKTIIMHEDSRALSNSVRNQLEQLQQMHSKAGDAEFGAVSDRAMLLTYVMVITWLAASAILIWFSWLTSRAITQPVNEMRSALLEAQRSNDLTQRVSVTGRNEVAEMGHAFNALMESLRVTLNRVRTDAQDVSTAATQMAAASSQITESSRAQSESAASTAAAVEEVTVSINQVADNTRETRSVSEQACELSTAGEKSARAAAEQMLGTAQSVGHSMQLIEQLSQRSKEISGIVKVIRDIAEQTNLLALNAAIEAARAGEQGRGFAVVADEVRKLAERTSSSTSEISGMIEAIQGEVARAVENLKSNNEQVAQGKSLAEEVAATLKRINEGARVTMEHINDISSAAAEQGTASNDIARNVEKIAQMTEETSAAITQASTTAQQLEALASKLHCEVAQFKTA
jgi:methyl-accepting chemotaxis protein